MNLLVNAGPGVTVRFAYLTFLSFRAAPGPAARPDVPTAGALRPCLTAAAAAHPELGTQLSCKKG